MSTVVNADDYADAVALVLARHGIQGRGVGYRVWRGPRIVVEIDTRPCDDDMVSLACKLSAWSSVGVDAAILEEGKGRHAFIFYPAGAR